MRSAWRLRTVCLAAASLGAIGLAGLATDGAGMAATGVPDGSGGPDGMVAREIALLEFYGGGGALSDAERGQAAAIVRDGLHDDAAAWRQADANGRRLLARIAAHDDAQGLAAQRAAGRLSAERDQPTQPSLAREQAAEAAIIRAHDPAIVWDKAHQRLITQAGVVAMLGADRACAPVLGVPVPGPDAAVGLAAVLRRSYPAMDQGMQQWVAAAEADAPAAAGFLAHMPAARRAAFVATWRPKIMEGTDDSERLLRLTQVVAGVGAMAQGAGGGGTPALRAVLLSRLRQQGVMQNSLLGASRSFSPSCNVATGANQQNFSYCHPVP